MKCGYSSPQTLTDQSTAVKRGQKGDLQVLRPHIMCCVPVSDERHRSIGKCVDLSASDHSRSNPQDGERENQSVEFLPSPSLPFVVQNQSETVGRRFRKSAFEQVRHDDFLSLARWSNADASRCRFIFRRLNEAVLGGRVKTMLCGGAVLSEETQRFVQAALCVTLFQGYGLTETCAAGTIADGSSRDEKRRH